ncbi:MAG: HlyD family type I secretion periplasmic adaptor subunit, partial [Natronospirillum sp.]
EGDIVEEGDLLVSIDPTRFEASVREGRAEYLSLISRSARLQALAADEPLSMPEEVMVEAPELAIREQRLYQSSRNEVDGRVSSAVDRLNQRQQELSEARARRGQVARSLAITQQELQMTRPLLAAGAVAEVDVLQLEREESNAEGDLEQIDAQLRRIDASISEAQRNLSEIELAAAVDWRQELSQTEARLSGLVESMASLRDRVAYTELRAPVRGIVQRLYITTRGGVVQPGREVLELVPLDDRLIVEVRIAPQDIAFLRPGLPAVVKITAYDFAQFGGLDGTVEHISADTITDDEGNTFYRVRIGTVPGEVSERFDVIPGMTAQVDILTGKRTVLEYLLKPVLRARDIALRER